MAGARRRSQYAYTGYGGIDLTTGTGGWRLRPARGADAEAIARVQIHTWQTTYRGIVRDDFLFGLDLSLDVRVANRRERLGNPQSHTMVAVTASDLVVGYADSGPMRNPNDQTSAGGRAGDEESWPEAYSGELYAIYILKGWQGLGVGTALMREAARHLQAAGHSSLVVWVLAENPARAFYERVGGRLVGQASIALGQQTLDEVAYAWADIGQLIHGG